MVTKIEKNLAKAERSLRDLATKKVSGESTAPAEAEPTEASDLEEVDDDEATAGMFATVSMVTERVNTNYATTARPPSIVNMSTVSWCHII